MKALTLYLSSYAIAIGCAFASLLASSTTGEWLVGAVCAAFIALFTSVVLPLIAVCRQEAKAARQEAKEAKEESLECRLWRAAKEPIIAKLEESRLTAVVTVTNQNGQMEIVSANEAAKDMFGQELVGLDVGDIVAPVDTMAHQTKMAAFFKGSEPRVAINNGHAIDAAGREFLVSVVVQRVNFRGSPALMAEIKKLIT